MQTLSSLADRLEIDPDWAIDRLRYMFYDVDSVDSVISDEACDLLIQLSDDPSYAERVRQEKLQALEKEKKKKERAKAAAKKGAATRKAAAAKKKAETEQKPEAEAAPAAVADAPPVVEILRGEAAEKAIPHEEPPSEKAKREEAAKKAAKRPAPPRRIAATATVPNIVIGSAVDHEPVVEIVRADGTHVSSIDELVTETETATVEIFEEVEEERGLLAEAERVQEEEEERKLRLAARPPIKPDPAVVAEVQRKALERMQKLQRERALEQRRAGTGKTARKKERQAEKARSDEGMRRDAAAAVREWTSAGALAPGMRRKKRKKFREEEPEVEVIEAAPEAKVIEVEESMTVERLAALMEVGVNDILLDLMDLNILGSKNYVLSLDLIRQIVEPKGYVVRSVIPEEVEVLVEEPDDPADLVPRAPVITVMGHVDHGKTTLLDRIRSTNVAAGEAGGITQHIAAYDVPIGSGRVVFLDTPGHEAFTQMRARGAQVTDIVVLVVAADDGVMPQTVEAIDHAKAADVPIVVAINKCDKPGAQPDRIRQSLMRYDLQDEAWGGKTIMRNISAKTGEGVDELLELLVLQADLMELKANPKKRARGVIIESEITKGQGPVAWVLVRNGTLRVGDAFLAGETYGRVRAMYSSRGDSVEEAGPAMPVAVTGFSAPPNAGDAFIAVEDERMARAISQQRAELARRRQGAVARHVTLEDFHEQLRAGGKNVLNLVLKADVQGSVDVLTSSLGRLGNQEVQVQIVHSGVGGINESDVLLASASDAVILGFHVTASPRAQKLAEQEGVDIRTYRVIYEAIDAVRQALEGMLKPETKETVTSHVEIRQVFRSSSLGNIAGCYVLDGEIHRGSLVRLTRGGVVVYEGRIASLRRMKDDVRSVSAGFECGIKLESFEDIKAGDIIEGYRVESVAKTLA